jgi:AraC family transcriptional regulator, transcriptional activator of pobA
METIPVRHLKISQQETNFAESFTIREVRSLNAGKNVNQELHRHDFFYILALKKAKGHHEIDFTAYRVTNHTVFFMRPGQVHQLTLKAGSTGYLMAFKPDFYNLHNNRSNQLLRKVGSINAYRISMASFKKLDTLWAQILQEYNGKQEGYLEVIKANLNIFFIELARQSSKEISNSADTYKQESLNKFSALLETHISTHKQVSQYADMLNLSVYQLNAITKETTGKTCSELIIEHILLESKRYLLATSNQVNQIAYHLGYEDASYFIRFFKKHTGYSPEAFRNNFR